MEQEYIHVSLAFPPKRRFGTHGRKRRSLLLVFQAHPDRSLELQRDLPAEVRGWRFSAPAVKEREHRLDGLFQPPADQADLPTVLLEAQMAADPKFLRRLYAQSDRLVEQEIEIEHWRVVVICPNRRLNFGSPRAVAEFVRERAIADVIAAIVVRRFNGRSIPELCAMGGITLEEFTQSVAYKEIFG
jgi:predicted transposase YdaD